MYVVCVRGGGGVHVLTLAGSFSSSQTASEVRSSNLFHKKLHRDHIRTVTVYSAERALRVHAMNSMQL